MEKSEWEKAKDQLDKMDFLEDSQVFKFKEIPAGENHVIGKQIHDLKTYKTYLSQIMGFDVMAKYNYCDKCKQVKSKKLMMFNNNIGTGVCYEKVFLRHGEAQSLQN